MGSASQDRIRRPALGLRPWGFALLLSCTAAPWAAAQVVFVERTEALGLECMEESFGCTVGDHDGDGWLDLWFSQHLAPPRLLRNLGDGTFRDVSEAVFKVGPGIDTHGAAWADFDGDGDRDLLQLVGAMQGSGKGRNLLFVNDAGRLTDDAEQRGVSNPTSRARTPVWLDWNGDGVLDFASINKLRPDGLSPTRVFLGTGKRFLPGPALPGLVDNPNHAWGQLADLTGDGRPDLLVGGDRGGLAVFEVGVEPPRNLGGLLGLNNHYAADTALADFDGDLRADIYVGSMRRSRTDQLLLQTDGGFDGAADDIPEIVNTRSVVTGDFDNDMDVDIYLVQTLAEKNAPNILLENQGQGEFLEVPDAGGAPGSLAGRGDSAVVFDLRLDGFLDLVVTNGKLRSAGDFGPCQLYENVGNDHHWVYLELRGKASNPEGIGARVLLQAGGVTQLREQGGGVHNFCQDDSRIHFGLGSNLRIDRIQIRWPSGTVQVLEDLPADALYRVVEQ